MGSKIAAQSSRDLAVWQKAIQSTVAIYKLTQEFPRDEQYGLTSQMRRSAVSIPSNIAEGRAYLRSRESLTRGWQDDIRSPAIPLKSGPRKLATGN